MELRHLKYFIAVAENLNYRRAAERLRVAQPALSRQIKDLEHIIGVKLFDRNTGGTMLTESGAALLEEARDIMERVEMAMELTRNTADGRRGTLHIAGVGRFSIGLLSGALSKFRIMYPKVEVSLHDIGMRDLLTELRLGTISLGFSFNQDSQKEIPAEFESVLVMRSQTKIAMSKNHPLATREAVSLEDFCAENILCVGGVDYHDLHRHVIRNILAARMLNYYRPIKQVGNMDLLMALIAGNYGVSLMPAWFFDNSPQIVLKPVNEVAPDLEIQLSAVWRKKSHARQARNFVDILSETKR